jgi:transposase
MQHIAIDLGAKESQICVRAEQGEILHEGKVLTSSLDRYLKRQPQSRVVLESCAEAFRIADFALSCEHQVRVVPATLVRSLGVGARHIKTDRRDAQVLSEASCRIDLPSVHIPTDVARQRRSMCGTREMLVASRTSLVCCVRGWARTQLLKVRSGEVETFAKRVLDASVTMPDGIPVYIERLLVAINSLNEQIAAADKEQAFLGLTPGENSSSTRQQRTGITKAGPAPVRRTLMSQAAWNIRRLRPTDPISQWAMEIEKRRGKFVATVAVARKLAGILFALWRDGSRYEPNHQLRQAAK